MFSKKEEIRIAYTVEQCESCNNETKKKFKNGDYIFKEISSQCGSCKGKLRISKIFGEVMSE